MLLGDAAHQHAGAALCSSERLGVLTRGFSDVSFEGGTVSGTVLGTGDMVLKTGRNLTLCEARVVGERPAGEDTRSRPRRVLCSAELTGRPDEAGWTCSLVITWCPVETRLGASPEASSSNTAVCSVDGCRPV